MTLQSSHSPAQSVIDCPVHKTVSAALLPHNHDERRNGSWLSQAMETVREESPSTTFSVRFEVVFTAGKDPVSFDHWGTLERKYRWLQTCMLYIVHPNAKDTCFRDDFWPAFTCP